MAAMDSTLIKDIQRLARPLTGEPSDYDQILASIGEKAIVLLGEATHGTHEFYRIRFEITKRLIEEKGFTAVALEADWPDCIHVNRHIRTQNQNQNRNHSHDVDMLKALSAFQRFPMWMWRNTDFLQMVEWLRGYNLRESTEQEVSLYGLDLYSLYTSIRAVIQYLKSVDPASATRAQQLYSCFEPAHQDAVRYGRRVAVGAQNDCEDAAIEVAQGLLSERQLGLQLDDAMLDPEELFYARLNADAVKDAEKYYRNLFNPGVNTWNIRDLHMTETVEKILDYLSEQNRDAKIVIWAHNSHVGDDRATEMGRHGQFNIGQLLRERYSDQTFTLGFTTYEGSVQAADEWDHPPRLKTIRPAHESSFEGLFHQVQIPNFYLHLQDPKIYQRLRDERLERAIGVIYSPATERISHYFHARIADQFDALIHIDRSHGVEPLDHAPVPELEEPSQIQY